ncbi:hypothetical protein BDV06DRAFT_235180 [Aspergillus oleicola]
MAPVPNHQPTTTVPIPIPLPERTPSISTSSSDTNKAADPSTEKPSKPRPITSCAACRVRKIKCNKAYPCSSCLARKTPDECSYASTSEDRSAIAAADLISELRVTKSKLQNQVNKKQLAVAAASTAAYGDSGKGSKSGREGEVLEELWGVLRHGENGAVREVVGRIRGGEGVESVLGGIQGTGRIEV